MTSDVDLLEASGAASRLRWQRGRGGENERRAEDMDFSNCTDRHGASGVKSGAQPGASAAVKRQHDAAGTNVMRPRISILSHFKLSNIRDTYHRDDCPGYSCAVSASYSSSISGLCSALRRVDAA